MGSYMEHITANDDAAKGRLMKGIDGKEDDIRRFLELGVSKTAIAKLTGVSRTTLYSFMSTRGLKPSP